MSTSPTYTIVAKHSSKCAGVPGYSNGAGSTQWDCWGGEDQQWTISRAHDSYSVETGYFYIKGKQSDKCLGASSTQSGTQATQSTCQNRTDQQWAFAAAGTGYYNIINKNSNYCPDVYELSQQNGGPIVQWPCNGQDNQKFQLAPQ